MKQILTIHWNPEAADSFRPMLNDSGIEFQELELFAKSQAVAAGATVVEILQAGAPYAASLAAVLVAWFRGRAKRHVYITVKDNEVKILTQNMSASDVSKMLADAKDISIVQIPGKDET